MSNGPDLRAQVMGRLGQILDPCSVAAGNGMNIVEMGLVDTVDVDDGVVLIRMCLTSPQCPMLQHFVTEANRVLADLPEVRRCLVVGDSGMEWTPDRMDADARRRRTEHLRRIHRCAAPPHIENDLIAHSS